MSRLQDVWIEQCVDGALSQLFYLLLYPIFITLLFCIYIAIACLYWVMLGLRNVFALRNVMLPGER